MYNSEEERLTSGEGDTVGNVRAQFLKGLVNPQVRAKVENLSYFLSQSFDAIEAAASHYKKIPSLLAMRRIALAYVSTVSSEC